MGANRAMPDRHFEKAFAGMRRPEFVCAGDPESREHVINRLLDGDPDELTADDFSVFLDVCADDSRFRPHLRYLLPSLLRIWREELTHWNGWFVSRFHRVLADTLIVEKHLSVRRREAVVRFMRQGLLDHIAEEESLCITDPSAAGIWFDCLADYGVFTKDVPALWEALWDCRRPGHAVAVVQYASCLICDDEVNPVFPSASPGLGGGPPVLWGSDTFLLGGRWLPRNVDYLSETLCGPYLTEHLDRALDSLAGPRAERAREVLAELTSRPWRAALRCRLLPMALGRRDTGEFPTWQSLAAQLATSADLRSKADNAGKGKHAGDTPSASPVEN